MFNAGLFSLNEVFHTLTREKYLLKHASVENVIFGFYSPGIVTHFRILEANLSFPVQMSFRRPVFQKKVQTNTNRNLLSFYFIVLQLNKTQTRQGDKHEQNGNCWRIIPIVSNNRLFILVILQFLTSLTTNCTQETQTVKQLVNMCVTAVGVGGEFKENPTEND